MPDEAGRAPGSLRGDAVEPRLFVTLETGINFDSAVTLSFIIVYVSVLISLINKFDGGGGDPGLSGERDDRGHGMGSSALERQHEGVGFVVNERLWGDIRRFVNIDAPRRELVKSFGQRFVILLTNLVTGAQEGAVKFLLRSCPLSFAESELQEQVEGEMVGPGKCVIPFGVEGPGPIFPPVRNESVVYLSV